MAVLTRDSPDSAAGRARPAARFATTRWSIVLGAHDSGPARRSREDALAELCRVYWYPVYAHIRRRGANAHDAEDLTQDFFARLIARSTFGAADPQRGRFRTFLLTALDHFLIDAWSKARTAKRGGGTTQVSLDLTEAEHRFNQPADPALSPDRAFDREWALALLASVLATLGDDYARQGKREVFAALKSTLTGPRHALPYPELARALGRSEAAIKVAVHRLRQHYRTLLEAAVADTLAAPEETSTELRVLLEALGA